MVVGPVEVEERAGDVCESPWAVCQYHLPVARPFSRLSRRTISTNVAPGNGTWSRAQSIRAQIAWLARRSWNRDQRVTYPARSPRGRSNWKERSSVAGGTLPVRPACPRGRGDLSADLRQRPHLQPVGGDAQAHQRRRTFVGGGGPQQGDHPAEAVAHDDRDGPGLFPYSRDCFGEVVVDVGGHRVLGVALVGVPQSTRYTS